jgi:hypothetical protein
MPAEVEERKHANAHSLLLLVAFDSRSALKHSAFSGRIRSASFEIFRSNSETQA